MTDPKQHVTTRELMDKIEELGKKLTKPEKPDMNAILRAEIESMRAKNTRTVDAGHLFPRAKKGA